MQLREYVPINKPIWAVQWNKEDSKNVLEWLTSVKCSYTFHEINSGGELIIYTHTGPVQVNDNDFIVQTGYEFTKMNEDLFRQTYEEV
jgi:hypothetical protein